MEFFIFSFIPVANLVSFLQPDSSSNIYRPGIGTEMVSLWPTSEAKASRFLSPPEMPFVLPVVPMTVLAHLVSPSCRQRDMWHHYWQGQHNSKCTKSLTCWLQALVIDLFIAIGLYDMLAKQSLHTLQFSHVAKETLRIKWLTHYDSLNMSTEPTSFITSVTLLRLASFVKWCSILSCACKSQQWRDFQVVLWQSPSANQQTWSGFKAIVCSHRTRDALGLSGNQWKGPSAAHRRIQPWCLVPAAGHSHRLCLSPSDAWCCGGSAH